MKRVWSPETATKAFLDTVKTCKLFNETSVAELISSMAGGWNAKLIVETWEQGGMMTTSIGLAIASHHTGGRHVCIVADEATKLEYMQAMEKAGKSPEVIVGEPTEETMKDLKGIDFMVVDCKINDFARVFGVAKLGERGAVLMCKNAFTKIGSDFRWHNVLDGKSRIVRTAFLPVGDGLDIAYVGASSGTPKRSRSKWIKHINKETREEFLVRIVMKEHANPTP
ncbi:hypothetical protein ACH5RR_041440 [Cinchona calisaya]|uniref:Uncharacterized protein n=1 Tax=Cinchona calisaya TaxID=153742 RepID=A0ABD2XZ10_9GENT